MEDIILVLLKQVISGLFLTILLLRIHLFQKFKKKLLEIKMGILPPICFFMKKLE